MIKDFITMVESVRSPYISSESGKMQAELINRKYLWTIGKIENKTKIREFFWLIVICTIACTHG